MSRDKPSYAELSRRLARAESELTAAHSSAQELGAALQQAVENRDRLMAEVQTQRTLLDSLIEYLPAGICIAEAPSGRVIRINERMRQLRRVEPIELPNSQRSGTFAGLDAEALHRSSEGQQLARVLKGEVSRGERFTFTRGDGTRGVMLSIAGPVRDAGGRIIAAVVVADDITELEAAKEEARTERIRAEMALEVAGMVTWEWDVRTGAIRYSRNLPSMVRGEAVALYCSLDSLMHQVHVEDCERLVRTLDRAVKQSSPWECKYRVRMLDGCHRWILSRGKIVAVEGGKPVRMLGTSIDITGLKEGEEKLRQSEAVYRAVGESIRYGVWVCAPDGRNTYASDSFLDLVGITQQQCSDFGWGDVLHPDDAERTIAAWKDCVRTEGVWDIEHRYRGVDGLWHPILARGVPVRDEEGRIACWAGINLDISTLKDAQEALRKAKEQLEQRVQERTEELSQTVKRLADEVAQRTVAERELQNRTNQLRSLASELTLTEQRERIRLAQILHDDLQQILVAAKFRLASAEHGEHRRQRVVETAELLDDAIQTSRSLTSELSPPILKEGGLVPALEWLARWMHDKHGLNAGLTVRDEIDQVSQEKVLLIFQAARELLFNVVKHAFTKTANLELAQTGGHIQIVVKDNGVGFDPAQIRGERVTSGGFGLFSIRERLGLQGGSLEIDSARGRGSRCTLIVPLAPAAGGAERSAEEQTEAQPAISLRRQLTTDRAAGAIRIVLVDDHMIMRQGLAELLRGVPGFEVVGEASDGASAVELVRDILPDVVLMDVSMPGMNGIQATEIIHREMPNVQVIGLSMFEEGDQSVAMREAGAVDYLTKSGPTEALIEAIRACCSTSAGG
jgi:PAS domain S-box-containing protein